MKKVRCNQCMKEFLEDEIEVIDDVEYCPYCGTNNALMDLEDKEA